MSVHVEVLESASMLKAALESVSDRTSAGYVPELGLVIVSEWLGEMDLAKTRRRLQALVVGMAGTIEGLGPNDSITVAWAGAGPRQPRWVVRPRSRSSMSPTSTKPRSRSGRGQPTSRDPLEVARASARRRWSASARTSSNSCASCT